MAYKSLNTPFWVPLVDTFALTTQEQKLIALYQDEKQSRLSQGGGRGLAILQLPLFFFDKGYWKARNMTVIQKTS